MFSHFKTLHSKTETTVKYKDNSYYMIFLDYFEKQKRTFCDDVSQGFLSAECVDEQSARSRGLCTDNKCHVLCSQNIHLLT